MIATPRLTALALSLCLFPVSYAAASPQLTAPLPAKFTADSCGDPDIDLTLSWDDEGMDWELHLVRPGGSLNDGFGDCTWTTCINESPDWGVLGDPSDNPHKDQDITGPFGPENICLGQADDQGVYRVYVEHWNSGGSPTADGQVVLIVNGTTYVSEVTDLPPHHVWLAATISMPQGVVEVHTEIMDCSGAWSGGCQMPGL